MDVNVGFNNQTIDMIQHFGDQVGMAIGQIFQAYVAVQAGFGILEMIESAALVIFFTILIVTFLWKLKGAISSSKKVEELKIENAEQKLIDEAKVKENETFHNALYWGIVLVIAGIAGYFLIDYLVNVFGIGYLKTVAPEYFAIQQLLQQVPAVK